VFTRRAFGSEIPLLVLGEAVALDAEAAAAIFIYKAADTEVAAVIKVATTVIILAMNDHFAGNLTLVVPLARLPLFALTEPPVVLLLVAVVALLAPALPVTLTEDVKVTLLIVFIIVGTNFEETEKVELFVTNVVEFARLVLTRMVVVPTIPLVAVAVGIREAGRSGSRGHRCADDRCRGGDASHVLQKLTPLYWFHISTPSLDVCHTLVAGDRGVYLKTLIGAATKQE
jgi:hypothetical protein